MSGRSPGSSAAPFPPGGDRAPAPRPAATAPPPCNIGPRERRRRLLFGLGAAAVGTGAFLYLLARQVRPGWALALFPLFLAAGEGIFQARSGT